MASQATMIDDEGEQVEIMPGSGVYVEHAVLRLMDRWRTRPSAMVRQLMLYLVGATKLKNMTARGKSGKVSNARSQIPPQILEAVKYYVDRKCIYKLGDAEYIRYINQQCCLLRSPYKPPSQNDKEHQTSEAPDLSDSD